MVDIDERVVSMKFDSSDFEKNTKSTMSILDKLHEKLSFKDVADSDSLSSITDNVQKMADKAYTIVDRMIDKIKDNIANKLVNFLQENTLGQFKAGFEKYADMTTSVATLSSQGYAMKRINEQLERLNYFTDETSYNFTSMVSEIGKFTASGQSLEDATTAMMGIAEWAALSGKNANEASRAMYQLSQALGSGTMRLIDYKSIQNLNMDTIEFRKNAIEAAIAAGTLKDNLNGTFTSLIDNKTTFAIQNFAESLSGKWFNSKVMMETYKKYSDAVDEIRAIYEEGTFTSIAGEDGKRKTSEFNTTADAVKAVKENNDLLIKKFREANKDLTSDQINDYLKKWKKVEKVTAKTVKDYAEIHEISEDEAKIMMEAQQKGYAEYLKEYGEVFKETEKTAEEALEDWHTYVSTYGIKAFEAAQEAKTFRDAIESAKDAASTVWTTIYTEVFGNYEEAKELWTDLANALYDIFVTRLWSIEEIFGYWKTGFEEDAEAEIEALQEEYDKLTEKGAPTDEYSRQRVEDIKKEIAEIQAQIDTGLLNGRRVLFQGLYAFGSGFKSVIENLRKAWDSLFDENESAKKLFNLSERIRYDGFRFYDMLTNEETGLVATDFYKNIAQGIKNLFAPFKGAIEVIKAVINSFLPARKTTKDILVSLSEAFKNFTEKLVPSQETLQKIAKILRGVVSVIRLIAKAAYGLWTAIIKPILSVLFDGLGSIFEFLTDILASMADGFYGFENAIGPMEALQVVAEAVQWAFEGILEVLKSVASVIWDIFGPAISFVVGIFQDLFNKAKNLFSGNKGDVFKNIGEGFKNVTSRAKAAWKSTETFADVFTRFKEGKGISNVIELLGELLDNFVTRIGRTIIAIFGLEDVITNENGKIGAAFSDLKGSLSGIATIFKWIYTNVIRPTLQVAFTGLANCIRDIGEAWKSGDVMRIMQILTQAFKTIGSFQLFKVLQALSRSFGSAGILRVLRNGAKALKSLSKWLGAKAVNEVSSAIFKLVLAFSLLLGVLTAMSFLPAENLERVSGLLLNAGIALGVMMVAMTTLSIVATKTRWGLVGIAGSMIAIVAATWTFIFVIEKIRQAIERFKDETEGFGGILVAIAPIIAVLAAMFIVFKAAAKIGNSGGLLAFSAGVMALGVAVFAMVFALDKMVTFLQDNTAENVISAILVTLAIMTTVALASGLMLRLVGSSFQNISKSAGALAMAVAIVTVALTTALIVIPLLDHMVENADRFPDYVRALAIFAATMISISGSFALMTSRTKGGFHMLAAGIVFNIFAKTIANIIMPLLESLKGLDFTEYLGGILALGMMMVAISYSIKLVMEGVAEIVKAISKINWKSWLAIILSTGAVIAGIMLLASYLENNKTEVSAGVIIGVIGTALAVILGFGLFAEMLMKITNQNLNNSISQLAAVFKWMTAFITSIVVGLAGTMALLKLLYDGNEMEALSRMAIFAGIVLATIGLTLLMFGKFIKSVSQKLSIIPDANLTKVRNLLITIFAGMVGIMLALVEYTIVIDDTFSRWEEYAAPLATIVATMIIITGGILAEIAAFINFLPTLEFNKSAVTIVIATLAAVLLDILAIGLILIPSFEKMRDVDWRVVLSLLAGIALIIFSISILTVAAAKTTTWEKTLEALATALGVLAAIAVFLPAIAKAFEAMKGIGWTEFAVLMLGFLIPFIAVLVAVQAMTAVAPAFAAAAGNIALGFIAIAAAIAAVAIAIGLLKEMFSPGSTLIGQMLMKGEAEGVKKGGKEFEKALVDEQKKGQEIVQDTNEMKSPSKVYKKYGKFIDLGLAQGITKNRRVAIKAATALAIFTNDGFCEELGIASPSKVFYENGRFVVRGFINGLNDETNKNKKAGADMAEGFTEGMDDMMDGMKDKWSGLWSELGMDEDIKNAIKDGTEGAGSVFANGLLDELMGEDSTVVTELTEEEKEQLANLKSEREQMLKDFERSWTGPHDASYEAAKKQITAQYDSQIDALEAKAGKTVKKNTGLSGLFSSVFGDSLTNLTKDTSIKDKLKEVGSYVGNGIMGIFDTDSSEGQTFSEKASGWFNGVLEDLGIKSEGEGNKTGSTVGGNIVDGAVAKFSSGEVQDKLVTMGKKIGDAVGNGIYDALTGWVSDALDWLSGTSRQNSIRKYNDALIESYMDHYGINDNHFVNLMHIAMGEKKDIILTPENVNEIYKEYKKYQDEDKYVSKIDLSNFGGWIADVLQSPTQYQMNGFEIHGEGGKTYSTSQDTEHNRNLLKTGLEKTYGLTYTNAEFEKVFREAILNNIFDDSNNTDLSRMFSGYTPKNKTLNAFVQYIQTDLFKSVLKDAYVTRSEAYDIIRKNKGYGDNRNPYDQKNTFGELEKVVEYVKKNKNYEMTGEDIIKMFYQGMENQWLKEENGLIEISGLTFNAFVQKICDLLGIKSPSTVAMSIMDYFMQGLGIGIEDGTKPLLDTLTDTTGLLTDSTITGLNAMVDALEEDVQPQITPVIDADAVNNGISSINTSFANLNPTMQATIDSFHDDAPNYNGQLAILANAINGTNTLVNNLMQMLAEGDIVTVNVTGEVDTNNLYELVVNTNREKFKQTGKNKLMSY